MEPKIPTKRKTKLWIYTGLIIVAVGITSMIFLINKHNSLMRNSVKIDSTNVDKVITQYILDKSQQHTIGEGDAKFVAFDKVWESSENNIYTVIGSSSVLFYKKSDGIISFPSSGSSNIPILVELSNDNGSYTVKSYKEVLSSTEQNDVWKEICKILPKENQDQLLHSVRSRLQAQKNFINWAQNRYGPTPQVEVGNHKVLYVMAEPTNDLTTGSLRKAIIESGMKFIEGCANEEWNIVQPICTTELWYDINFSLTKPDTIRTSLKGANYSIELPEMFKSFHKVTDPVYDPDNNTYKLIISFNADKKVKIAYLTVKSTAGNDFLIDSIVIKQVNKPTSIYS